MERLQNHEKFKSFSKLFTYTLGAYLVWEISFSSKKISRRTKEEVIKRSNGHCENCKRDLSTFKVRPVVGHINHDRRRERIANYNHLNNLRNHCPFCEAKYHISHVGQAFEIGMREKDNKSTAYSWLVILALNFSRQEFMEFYNENIEQVGLLFRKMEYSFPAFLAKYYPS